MDLKFQFESLSDFLTMSGHGPFVWASYAVTLLAIIYLLVAPIIGSRQKLAQLRKRQRIAQASESSSSDESVDQHS
jgi:heme exporter protein D